MIAKHPPSSAHHQHLQSIAVAIDRKSASCGGVFSSRRDYRTLPSLEWEKFQWQLLNHQLLEPANARLVEGLGDLEGIKHPTNGRQT